MRRQENENLDPLGKRNPLGFYEYTERKIIILGGGTAGLITALMAREKYPKTEIHIIKSEEIGIIGVGEGSTEHWRSFMDYVGIIKNEMIPVTDATIKIGILFSNWNGDGKEYVHSVISDHNFSGLSRLDLFKALHVNSLRKFKTSPFFEDIFYKNLVPIDNNLQISNQFHFDTFKLNKYLLNLCDIRGIKIINTTIVDSELDENGNVKCVKDEAGKTYHAEFFVDCSGFKRILAKKLGLNWKSYKEFLPLNRAIAFPTEHTSDNYEPYTKATSMKNGWMWRIPTQQRYGNGYVFSEEFTNSDEALNEASELLGINVEKAARDIKFEAGRLEKLWHKNVLFVGLSGGFCEPLEAQSIGFTVLQSFAFVDALEQWFYNRDYVEKAYNKIMDRSFENVVSFLQLHYFCKRDDSEFWKNIDIKVTDFNLETMDIFANGYCDPFLFEDDKYLMFKSMNFFQVYSGLELFNYRQMVENFTYNRDLYNQQITEKASLLDGNSVIPLTMKHSDALNRIRYQYDTNKHHSEFSLDRKASPTHNM